MPLLNIMKREIEIIYEDRDLLAVNKPAGILVHKVESFPPEADQPLAEKLKVSEETLVDWLVKKYPEIRKVGDAPEIRPGIVHRLDKDTSGVLLIAKNQETFNYLKKQFQERKIIKKYLALVVGEVRQKEGKINLAIGRGKKNPLKRTALGKTSGRLREALTYYKVLKKFNNYTLLEVQPKTGRTHQIRTHLKAIGHPLICDRLYAGKLFQCPANLKRHFLHAFSLEFTLPTGSRLKLEADLPADLKNTLEKLK